MSAELDISYRPRGLIGGLRVGAHRSRALGSLGTFRDQVSFLSYPDARRVDIRATLRDPFQNTFVRRFQQRAAIDVWMLADLSGSLAYEGVARKKDLIIALGVALAQAATRIGDRFGLFACGATIRDECTVSPTKRPGIVTEVKRRLAATQCIGNSAAGLIAAAERLAGARKMVFLVSDFLLPLNLLQQIFEGLAQHDVVPIVIGDSSEDKTLPDWGLVELADLESGTRRLVFMRPKLKARWLENLTRHHDAVDRVARQFGRKPVILADTFDADHLSRELLET